MSHAPDGTVRARIFDLHEELPFAGHPILGAAAALHALAGKCESRQWTFDLSGRKVNVEVEVVDEGFVCKMDQGHLLLEQPIQEDPLPWASRFSLEARDLHPLLPLQIGSTGLRYLVVPVKAGALERARIDKDISLDLQKIGAEFAVLFDPENMEIRHWDNDGLTEDVATGSAAGVVAGYGVHHKVCMPGMQIRLSQGRFAGRPSQIIAECGGSFSAPGPVSVGGNVTIVGQGTLSLYGRGAQLNDRRLIGSATLRSAISFEDLLEPTVQAFKESSSGNSQSEAFVLFPGRAREDGDVHVKAGVCRGRSIFIVKAAPWFAHNVEFGKPQGGIISVFDSQTGYLRAQIEDEHYLSDIRTAAAGAVAARYLATKSVRVAAVLGSGVQAYWQSLALFHERPYQELRVHARAPEKAAALAKRLAPRLQGVTITVAASAQDAVRDAQVIITATSSAEPVLLGAWLKPGQHVTAVGADDPFKCELDAAALQRSRVFVDDRKATIKAGDVFRAITLGEYDESLLAGEIGQVIAGSVPGRENAEQITIATLVGIGAQDVAACEEALHRVGY